jgi:hypothetical protein
LQQDKLSQSQNDKSQSYYSNAAPVGKSVVKARKETSSSFSGERQTSSAMLASYLMTSKQPAKTKNTNVYQPLPHSRNQPVMGQVAAANTV